MSIADKITTFKYLMYWNLGASNSWIPQGLSWAVQELIKKKVNIKCTFVQALKFCTGRTAHRVSRGLALFFLDHGTRRGLGVSVTSRPLFILGKEEVHTVQEAVWAPGPAWTSAEILAHIGIRSRTAQPVASRYNDGATGPTRDWFTFPLYS